MARIYNLRWHEGCLLEAKQPHEPERERNHRSKRQALADAFALATSLDTNVFINWPTMRHGAHGVVRGNGELDWYTQPYRDDDD